MKILISLILFFGPQAAQAADLAFLVINGADGKPMELEPGGRFAHVALNVGKGWLHSHPARGVEIISLENLRRMGSSLEFASIASPGPGADEVQAVLGRPYDPNFSWDNEKLYCAEVVAKLLKIQPQPMNFQGRHWGSKWSKRRGELGLSPDDLWKIAQARGPAGKKR